MIFNQAHNHYLQIAAEGGVLVGVPVCLALAVFAARALEQPRAGSVAACTSSGPARLPVWSGVALQSFWETGLTIPANAALAAVLAAIVLHRPAHAARPAALMSLRIGIDVDGVLADFRTALPRDLESQPGARHRPLAGLARHRAPLPPDEVKRVWEARRPDAELVDDVEAVRARSDRAAVQPDASGGVGGVLPDEPAGERGRLGAVPDPVVDRAHGFYMPSVLTIPGSRGEVANGLRLHLAIDDLLLNCIEVVSASTAKALLLQRRGDAAVESHALQRGIGVVPTLKDAIEIVQRLHALIPARKGRLMRLADWFSPPGPAEPLPVQPSPDPAASTRRRTLIAVCPIPTTWPNDVACSLTGEYSSTLKDVDSVHADHGCLAHCRLQRSGVVRPRR